MSTDNVIPLRVLITKAAEAEQRRDEFVRVALAHAVELKRRQNLGHKTCSVHLGDPLIAAAEGLLP